MKASRGSADRGGSRNEEGQARDAVGAVAEAGVSLTVS